MKLSEEGFVVMDIRIGRLNKIDEYFKNYPERLNEKVFASQEFGTPKNHSALELAVLFGHQSILRWLVKKGAKESMMSSPNLLVLAVNQQNDEMIKTVTDFGFNPWMPSFIGVSPISLATGLGWDRGLSIWRQSGVSLKKRTKSGGTLFHELLEKNQTISDKQLLHMCRYLFECGVKWTKDKDGRTPLEVASNDIKKETLAEIWTLAQKIEAQKTKKKLTKATKSVRATSVSSSKLRRI